MKIILLTCLFSFTQLFGINNQKIVLEENDDIILTGAISIEINMTSEKLLIMDRSSKSVYLYSAKTGKLINSFNVGIFLSDSLAYSGKEPYTWDFKNWEYIDRIELVEIGKESLIKNLKNYINVSYFNYNDDIMLGAVFYAVVKDMNGNELQIDVSSGLIELDKNMNIKNVTIIENNRRAFAQKIMTDFKDIIYVKTVNNTKADTTMIDLPSISRYDKNGFFIDNYEFLPQFFTEQSIGYDVDSKPKFTFRGKELIYAYQYTEKIIFTETKKEIKLTDIGISNKEKYATLSSEKKKQGFKFAIWDHFPVKLNKLYYNNNELYVFLRIKYFEKRSYELLQIYDASNGKLLKQTKVKALSTYHSYTLSKDFKHIYSFDLEDENYVVRKTKVESLWEK